MGFGNAWDNLNYGSASTLGAGSYDDKQYNSVGEPLEQTPLNNGEPIANDYENDQRNAMDVKKSMHQAKQDTANVYDDEDENPDDYIVFNDGTKTKKVDDSHLTTGLKAATGFLTNYLAHMSEDANKAIAAGAEGAGKAVSAHEDLIKRQNILKDLDNKTDSFGNPLYNSMDIIKYGETGDLRDLTANQGKWTSDGNGWMHNTLTGQSRQIPGYATEKAQQVRYLKNPDGTYSVVNPYTDKAGSTVGQAAPDYNSLDDSGDDGTGEGSTNHGYTFQNGQWVKPKYNSKGVQTGYDVAGPQQSKQLNEQQAAKQPSATETQQNKNINLLLGASDKQVEGFTGKIDQLADINGDYTSLNTSDDNRDYLAAAKEINGYMQNQGIGAAKAMGLVGIDRLEEAKRAFASMPQLDRSSPKAFRDSVQRIRDYVNDYNSQHKAELGVTAPAASTGKKDHSSLW